MEQTPTQDLGADTLEAPPSLTRTTVRGVRIASAGYVVSTGLQFVGYLVLARLISPTGFGIYAAGTVVTGIGGLFADSGMLSALINRTDRLDEAASTAFFSLLVSGSLLLIAGLAVAPLIGVFYGRAHVTAIAAAMSGWLLIRALNIVPDALLQRRFSFLRRVVIDPLGVLAWAAASIPLAATGAGAWALVGGTYAMIIVQAISSWRFARFVPRFRLASLAMWRELAGFARPVILAEILRRVSQQVDALTLGKFQGTAPLGQYRNGLRLTDQPATAFVAVISYVLYPAFARIATVPGRIAGAARRVYWVAMTFTVPISLAALPLGVPLAVIFFGSRWRPAGHAIAGLCGIVVALTTLSIASELFKSISRPRTLVGVQAVGFGLIIASVPVSAAVWGLLGVAIAMSASYLATAVFGLARVCRLIGIPGRDVLWWFAGPTAAGALMVVAMLAYASGVHLLSHPEGTRVLLLVSEVAVGAIVYGVVLAAIDAPRRREALAWLRRRGSAQLEA